MSFGHEACGARPRLAAGEDRRAAALPLHVGAGAERGFHGVGHQSPARSGRWERLEPRVYRIAGSRETWEQRLMCAVLGAGDGQNWAHPDEINTPVWIGNAMEGV